MIPELIAAKLVAVAGVSTRVSPDIRRGTGDALPCVVYEIESDDRIPYLDPDMHFGMASCTVHCLALTLVEATALAKTITNALHGSASWTVGTATAYSARVTSLTCGTLDDGESGASDLTRSATLRIEILHQF